MTETFWCKTHLENLPVYERSPDSRYCQVCYEFLLKETRLEIRKKYWFPDPDKYPVGKATESKSTLQKSVIISQDSIQILSTLKEEKNKVDKNDLKTSRKRGRGKIQLPEELIKKLYGQGLGSKAIATMLKKEGVCVSYKTIQRMLIERKVN